MSNYAIFPQKVLKISQSWNGSGHSVNSSGSPADYPIDITDTDSGRQAFYAPCRMKCVKIYGLVTGANTGNGAWFTSTEPVDFPDGTRDYLTIKFVHMENSDFGANGIHVNRIYEKYEFVGYEGKTGVATGNHLHVTAGKGQMKGSGWTQKTDTVWVLQTTGGQFKPDELLYVDRAFTTVADTDNLHFKDMPTTPTYKYPEGTICRLAQGVPVYNGVNDAQPMYYSSEACVKVFDHRQGTSHPYFISTANWDGNGNNDTGCGIGWVDESALSLWVPKYSKGTLVRIAQGSNLYLSETTMTVETHTSESQCVKVWDKADANHQYFISTANWDGNGNNDTGCGIGWVDESALTPWSAKYPNGTLVRIAQGSNLYYSNSSMTVNAHTSESSCVKVWDSEGANHPYFISAPGWQNGDGSDGYGTGIAWVDESALSPWMPALADGQIYRLSEGTAIYVDKNKYTGSQPSDNMSCVKLFFSDAGAHPCFISTTGWNGGEETVQEHGIGFVDESALTPWTQLWQVGQKVKYWGGKVFSTLNGIEETYPRSGQWTVAEIVDYKPGEHPYFIKDTHNGVPMGWVSEYTIGAYTQEDVTACSKCVAGILSLSEDQVRIYDMNGDGKLTMSDVTAIAQLLPDEE